MHPKVRFKLLPFSNKYIYIFFLVTSSFRSIVWADRQLFIAGKGLFRFNCATSETSTLDNAEWSLTGAVGPNCVALGVKSIGIWHIDNDDVNCSLIDTPKSYCVLNMHPTLPYGLVSSGDVISFCMFLIAISRKHYNCMNRNVFFSSFGVVNNNLLPLSGVIR
jgi:hypothetical protein